MPKRVGEQKAQEILEACLPLGAKKAKELGVVDEVFSLNEYEQKLESFVQKLIEDEDSYDDFLWDKEDYLEENRTYIESCKAKELKTMHPEFWDQNSEFHILRYEFVYKLCPTQTPKRLKFSL